VAVALAFRGVAHIPLRIGTAMILAIALGLAADDTIYLSLQVKRRVAAGSDPSSALHATLRRTGRLCCYSSIVLICGFLSMTTSSLVALQDMGKDAAFTMLYALATDILLEPAIYRLLVKPSTWAAEGRHGHSPLQFPERAPNGGRAAGPDGPQASRAAGTTLH
jgi:predicted RND superfamily exporter protein